MAVYTLYLTPMKKIFYVLAIIVVLIGIILYNQNWNSAITEVVSDDGKATLYITPDALPDGVSIEDISITSWVVEDFYGFSTGAAVFGYDVKPDGLQLQKPVTLKIESDWEIWENENEVGIPLLIHKPEKDTFEVVDDIELDFDRENKKLTVSGEVEHFSPFSMTGRPNFLFNTKD